MANPMLDTTLYLVGAVANRGYLDSDIEKRWQHLLSVWRLLKEGTSANLMSHIRQGIVEFDNSRTSYIASYNPWSTSNYSQHLQTIFDQLSEACQKRAQLLRYKNKSFDPETPVSEAINALSTQIDGIQRQIDSISGDGEEHEPETGSKVSGNALDLQVAWMLLRISDLKHRYLENPKADPKDHVYNVPKAEMQSLSEAYARIVHDMPKVYPKSNVLPQKSSYLWQQVLTAVPESGALEKELTQRAALRCVNENYEWLETHLEGTIQGHKEQGKSLSFKPSLMSTMAEEFRGLCINHMHFKQLMSTDIKMNEEVIVTEDKKPLYTESELSPLAKAVVYCINKRISEKDLSKDAEARYHRTMELMNEMSFAYKIQTMSLIDSAREEFGKGWSRNYLNILNPLFEKFQVASEMSMRMKSPVPLNEAFEEVKPMIQSLRMDVVGEFARLRDEAFQKKKPFPSITDVEVAWLHLTLGSQSRVYPDGLELPVMLDMLSGLEKIMKGLETELPRKSSHIFTAGPTGKILSKAYLSVENAAQYLKWDTTTDPEKAKQSLQFITGQFNAHFEAFQRDIVETEKAYKEQKKTVPFDTSSTLKLLSAMQQEFGRFVTKARHFWDNKQVTMSEVNSTSKNVGQEEMLRMFQNNRQSTTATSLSELVMESEQHSSKGPATRSKTKKHL